MYPHGRILMPKYNIDRPERVSLLHNQLQPSRIMKRIIFIALILFIALISGQQLIYHNLQRHVEVENEATPVQNVATETVRKVYEDENLQVFQQGDELVFVRKSNSI